MPSDNRLVSLQSLASRVLGRSRRLAINCFAAMNKQLQPPIGERTTKSSVVGGTFIRKRHVRRQWAMDLEQIGITKNRIEHRIGLPRLDRAVQVAGQIGGRQMKSVVVAVSAWRYGRCIGGPHVRCTKACCHQNRIGLPSFFNQLFIRCLLYTSPSPRDQRGSRMPSSA